MLYNYFLLAVRKLKNNKLYSIISILGLSLGLSILLLAIGHYNYEMSFENFHKNKNNIYRINSRQQQESYSYYSATTVYPLAKNIGASVPGIRDVAIFRELGNINISAGKNSFISVEETSSYSVGYKHRSNVFAATPGFLNLFTLPLINGDPNKALTAPNSVVITESAATRLFYGEQIIGNTVTIFDSITCTITGILQDIPENTQLYCDLIVSYSTLEKANQTNLSWEEISQDYCYLLLENNVDIDNMQSQINEYYKKQVSESSPETEFELMKLKDIYFSTYSSFRANDLTPNGEMSFIITLLIISFIILFLAIFNFVNLSVAKFTESIREVGIRKIFGAYRNQLMGQFLVESVLITFLSMILSIFLYEFLRTETNIIPREMFSALQGNIFMYLIIVALIFVVGIISGAYPAFKLSGLQPYRILQLNRSFRQSGSVFKKILIILQFVTAIVFVFVTLVISGQFRYITSLNSSFNNDNTLLIKFHGKNSATGTEIFSQLLRKIKAVSSVSAMQDIPGEKSYRYNLFFKTAALKEEEKVIAKVFFADI